MNKIKNYLAMWDNTGLECIFDIDEEIRLREEHEQNVMWDTLKGNITKKKYKSTIPPLDMMIMRARFNSHRHYEIYQFATKGLSIEDVKSIFKDNPQFIVDFIRENGSKVYSARSTTVPIIR